MCMFCSSCGTELSKGVNYCHTCGSPVGSDDNPLDEVISTIQKYDLRRAFKIALIMASIGWWLHIVFLWDNALEAKALYYSNEVIMFQVNTAIKQLYLQSVLAGALLIYGIYGSSLAPADNMAHWLKILYYLIGIVVYVAVALILTKLFFEHFYFALST